MKESNEEMIKRLKEEELKELKKRKEILEQVKQAKKMQSLNKSMQELEKLLENNDDTQEWIDKLNQKSLENEVKTEMFLENHKTTLSEEEMMIENAKKLIQLQKNNQVNNIEKAQKNSLTLGDEEFDTQNKNNNQEQNLSNTDDSTKSII